jgi:hypothetical protein
MANVVTYAGVRRMDDVAGDQVEVTLPDGTLIIVQDTGTIEITGAKKSVSLEICDMQLD